MRWPWPSRSRTAVLAACALAIERDQAVGPALEAMAVDDPEIAPHAQRIAAALRRGRPLAATLHHLRLLDREEHRITALAEAQGCLGAVLPSLASSRSETEPRMLLWRWFPTWVALAMVGGAVYAHLALELVSGISFSTIFAELAIELPEPTATAFSPLILERVLVPTACLLGVFGLQLLFAALPPLGLFRLLGGVTIERTRLALRLLRYGRLAEAARGSEVAVGPEHWYWTFHWFWMSMAFRLDADQRAEVAAVDTHDLPSLLTALGLVEATPEGCDWDTAQSQLAQRLRHQARPLNALLGLALLVLALWSFTWFAFMPLIKIIEQIG